jgi:UDP-N-acetylmuramate dehydrogenase
MAEELVIVSSHDEMVQALSECDQTLTILGYGCNVLISDNGLSGKSIMWRTGGVVVEGDEIIADGGVWWDDVVQIAIAHNLWGLELMSQIPSSVGGAVFGNIAAYGQQVSDTLDWIEIFNCTTKTIQKHNREDFEFSYRSSSLQNHPEYIILRAGFTLSREPKHELRYDSALSVARELGLETNTLENRRKVITETRARAGSLYNPNDPATEHTAGSFFKNPLVNTKQARELASFDETGKTLERIENQNRIHGGDTHRASAAHVLLAAGFSRGQAWGRVKLHDQHILKLQTLEGATAQNVYNVVEDITNTVHVKLGITLEPEVKFLGKF